MSLKLYKSVNKFFDCVMNATAKKVKVGDMFVIFLYGVKCRKKITANYNSFGEMYPMKGL